MGLAAGKVMLTRKGAINPVRIAISPAQQAWAEMFRAERALLISDERVAGDYAALKLRLAYFFRNDRERYTEGKGPFIEGALRRRRRGAAKNQ